MISAYTKCPITFMVYQQNKQPEEFKELDNEKFIDKNGIELWSWCKENGLESVGQTKHCFNYQYFKADEKYLILINQGSCEDHKWRKEDCVADFGGSWGSGGVIRQYQDIEVTEQLYREKNEGKSYSCLKGFSKLFMTERAWAVAKLMKEKKSYIPDEDLEGFRTIREKADECIHQLNDYYLFLYPERGENNSHYPLSDLKFWVTKVYSEERFNQEYEKAKRKQLPYCFAQQEKNLKYDLKAYLEDKDKDIKYAQNWLRHSIDSYGNLKRIAQEMGERVRGFKEYEQEAREEIKQKIKAELKIKIGSNMAKEVLREMENELGQT